MHNNELYWILLSEFQTDQYFWKKNQYSNICLVNINGVDWCAIDGIRIDSLEVLILKLAKNIKKTIKDDSGLYI